MKDWFKKLTGQNSLANKSRLSGTQRNLLAADFSGLKKVRADLPGRTLDYVVDDTQNGILHDLQRLNGCGDALGLTYYHAPKPAGLLTREPARKVFFDNADDCDPGVLLRLAKVYQAAVPPTYARTGWNGAPAWLEEFVYQLTHCSGVFFSNELTVPRLQADTIEKMLELDGSSPDVLVSAVFLREAKNEHYGEPWTWYVAIPGFANSVFRNHHIITEALTDKGYQKKLQALTVLAAMDISLAAFQDNIAELAVSSSAKVREMAQKVAIKYLTVFLPLVRKHAADGSVDERINAVRFLSQHGSSEDRKFIHELAAKETSEKVLEELRIRTEKPSSEVAAFGEPVVEIPPAIEMKTEAPLSVESIELFKKALTSEYKPINISVTVNHAIGLLQGKTSDCSNYQSYARSAFRVQQHTTLSKSSPLCSFLDQPDVQIIHVIRLLILTQTLVYHHNQEWMSIYYRGDECIQRYRKSHPEIGLREIGAAVASVGIPVDLVGWNRLSRYNRSCRFEDEATWPYYAEKIHILEQALGVRTSERKINSYEKNDIRRNALEVIAMFPTPPAQLVPVLWDVALGSSKVDKPIAFKALVRLPNTKEKLLESLKSGKQELRASAAEWLAAIQAEEAVPDIKTALKKEKSDTAKVAMMSALESFGVSLDEFLNLQDLQKEAAAGLQKGIPEQLVWLQFDHLPKVHWKDSGELVPCELVTWWIVQQFRIGNPEPSPLIRRYCSLLNQKEREVLGMFILSAWIEQDTKTYTYDQALIVAKQQAQQASRWVKTPIQELEKQFMEQLLKECEGSAVKEKGILAVAAACCGNDAAPVVQRYLKQWYGMRAAQCKALVRMLAWVEDRAAIQLLLATSVRFRTKGIREEADICVKALAERRGWTVDELADRTMPTAGFDENAEMMLDYGPRAFTGKLDKDFNIVLKNEEGNIVSSLPDPRKDDGEEKAKEAKQLLSSAKKELKSVLKAQKDRLYEAMCTQRIWTFDDWNTYLNSHPIVRYYCQSLVWMVTEEDTIRTFRPLDDGTLTDINDDEITVESECRIKLAHICNVTQETASGWIKHFKDYEVTYLFDQFNKPAYYLSEKLKEERELTEFEGYLIEAFKLRSMATKLGYTRGSAEDGGWFSEYNKIFPAVGLEAVISFTGSPLPEEDRTVALTGLSFTEVAPDTDEYFTTRAIPLGEVPPVLLSECRNDIRTISLAGSGHDPDWKKKVGW